MNPFTTALIKAPKRSTFDFSHDNTLSVSIGEGTPSLCEFIVPGDEVSVNLEQICRVAPMPVPTFVPLKVRHDFFFVPLRLLYGNDYMDTLFGDTSSGQERASLSSLSSLYKTFAGFNLSVTDSKQYLSITENYYNFPFAGSLFDHLGYPVLTDRNGGITPTQMEAIAAFDAGQGGLPGIAESYSGLASNQPGFIAGVSAAVPKLCVEPLFAYHFIWRDWYRFTGIEDNSILEPFLQNGCLKKFNTLSTAPASSANLNSIADVVEESQNRLKYAHLGRMFNVHAKKDMFLSARYGNKPTVLIPTGDNGTIPALREASAIQRFLDIISITGQRYFDKVKGLFGIEPEGPKDDRVQFLGRYQSYIKVGEVITTASTDQAVTGDYAGRGILVDGKYIFNRRFTEHGWLFCITSVVPELSYSGLSRQLTDVNVLDTPVPVMAQVGDQSILNREVFFDFHPDVVGRTNPNNSSFGDQFRYYAYKSHNNEVHGTFLMDTFRPWSALMTNIRPASRSGNIGTNNVIGFSRIVPEYWNYLFNDTDFETIWGSRFYLNLNFGMRITRALPKYINYHL